MKNPRALNFSIAIIYLATSVSCSRPLNVKGVKVARTAVESTVTTTSSGTVEARQQAVLGFSAPGRVSKVLARAGDRVRRRQLLAQLDNGDLSTIAADAGRELKRAKELFSAGLVSRVALDEAKRNREVAEANLDKSTIRAPFDGTITELNLDIGELAQSVVSSVNPPMRIVDLAPRLVKGRVDEVDLSKIRIGSRARIKVPAVRTQPFDAKVSKVVPFVNATKEQDRTSLIELEFLGPSSQIPVGASADVEVVTAAKDDVIAVPTSLVLGHGEQRYIFQVISGKLHKTDIKTGTGNYDRTEILSGVTTNDIVVYPPEDLELQDGRSAKVELAPWP